jgi:hypothetical protein
MTEPCGRDARSLASLTAGLDGRFCKVLMRPNPLLRSLTIR